jgi:hypothetical protein
MAIFSEICAVLWTPAMIFKYVSREKLHLKALGCLAKEDRLGCMHIYEDILFDHPLDAFALQLYYFSALYSGKKEAMRDGPARVVDEYKKTDKYYG